MREEEAAREAGGQILKRITGTPPATGKTFGLLLLAPQHVQCGINPEGFFCVGGRGDLPRATCRPCQRIRSSLLHISSLTIGDSLDPLIREAELKAWR